MSNAITGGCLCGNIRYSVSQPIEKLIACHCTHCQKTSGVGVSHNAPLPSSAVTFTAGTTKLYADTAQSGNILNRYFCADCGSPIYIPSVGTPGGCNPIALSSHVENGTLVIDFSHVTAMPKAMSMAHMAHGK